MRGAADPWHRRVVSSGAALVAPTVVSSGVNLLLVAESGGTVAASYASVLSPRTASFTPLVRVTPGTDTGASRPAACVGPDGIARVVYTAQRDGVLGVYLATEFVRGVWLPSTVDTSTADPELPSIAAGNGALVVAWRGAAGVDDGVYTWAGAGTVQVVAGRGVVSTVQTFYGSWKSLTGLTGYQEVRVGARTRNGVGITGCNCVRVQLRVEFQ